MKQLPVQLLLTRYIIIMKNPLNLVIRNTKSTPRASEESYSRACSVLATERKIQAQFPFQYSQNQEQRLRALEGNLRTLQQKYKQNLKEGFQSKIKAYRLEAVVERKLLRQAVQQAQKIQEKEQIKQKILEKQQLVMQRQQKVLLYKVQKIQKEQFINKRNDQQKKRMSLTIFQRQSHLKKINKESHDRIRDQQQHSGHKKLYFQELRKITNQKQTLQTKRQLLQRIVRNTTKLKNLKQTLQGMQTTDSQFFVTLS